MSNFFPGMQAIKRRVLDQGRETKIHSSWSDPFPSLCISVPTYKMKVRRIPAQHTWYTEKRKRWEWNHLGSCWLLAYTATPLPTPSPYYMICWFLFPALTVLRPKPTVSAQQILMAWWWVYRHLVSLSHFSPHWFLKVDKSNQGAPPQCAKWRGRVGNK